MKTKLLIATVVVAFLTAPTSANWAPGDAPFINTWLVLGTYDNREGAGMKADLIGEATIRPRTGEQADGWPTCTPGSGARATNMSNSEWG